MSDFENKLNGILNNPAEMQKIMALAQNFMGGSADTAVPPTGAAPPAAGAADVGSLLGGVDPAMMAKLAKGLSAGTGTAALLQAMTPHLKMERQGQLKRAITVAQMLKAAKAMLD